MNLKRATIWSVAAASGLALAGFAASGTERETGERAAGLGAAAYEVDGVHSTVLFRVKHAGVTNFYGRFNRIDTDKSTFTFDPDNPSAGSFTFVIDNASVDTGNQGRDNHLRNADFFNVAQFPTTTFKSTSIEAGEEPDTFVLNGDLTLHGETHPVEAKLKWLGEGEIQGNPVVAFEAEMEFKRSDWGMTKYVAEDGSDSGGLGNNVGVLISVEARPKG